MRHHSKKKIFGRVKSQRTALGRSMARSLILDGGIVTTEAKAKALRPSIEKLVTRAKVDSVANRRLLAARLGNDAPAIKKLYETIAPKYKERAGGYTRIVKLQKQGARSAAMARIEFV